MALVEGCKHSLEVTIPVEEVQQETTRVVDKIRAKAQLPGFRPGKVPDSLIRSRFKKEIEQDVLESIIPKFFRKRAEADGLNVVGAPNVSDLSFEAGKPLVFKADFEVAPDFDLRDDYRGLPVVYQEPVASEEDVDKRISALREQKAEYVNLDPRPAEAGDHVLVKLRSVAGVEGEPVNEEGISLHLGDDSTLPAFTENLVGMAPGEEKEFEVAYPDDYGSERLSGKTVKFHVTLSTLRKKELPELNDEFAQDLGDFKTLDELKETARKSILAEKENEARNDAKNKLVDALVNLYDFPIPDAYVDRQIEMTLEQRLRSLAGQGIDPRSLNIDWAKLRESQKERAARDVRASLLLDRVASREALHASKEEVDAEVQRISRQEREAVAATRRRLEQDGTLDRIANHIRTEKTLNLIFEHATKTAE